MSDDEEKTCAMASKLDKWARAVAGMVLVGVVLVDMLGLWAKEPPTWFMGVLLLLAIGVEITAIRTIVVDVLQKQFTKK